MPGDILVVVRSEFSMEDPWAMPRSCEPVRLRRATDGKAPRLATTVAAYYDDQFLTILFSAADDHIVATHFGHDEPLYEEDVVEAFLAPRNRRQYFEIEVNPLGTTFDARVDSPDGIRATMIVAAWECEGLVVAIRKMISARNVMTVDTVMRVPFASVGSSVPGNGDSWLANFFRVDRHPREGDEYTAWRPTMKNPPDFHVAEAFGRLIFRH